MEFSPARDGSHHDRREVVEVAVIDGDPVIVRITGRLLVDTIAPLADALSPLAAASCPRMVLDLRQVPMCDSSALSLLVRTRSSITAAGGWLRLAGVQPMVDTVLRVTNLTRILACYPSVEDAAADA